LGRSSLLNDGTTWTASSWIAISAVSQVVELNWRAASGVGANDDGLTFWIDGNQVADPIGIDNRICDFCNLQLQITSCFGISPFQWFERRFN
jgi:hypothetical protein